MTRSFRNETCRFVSDLVVFFRLLVSELRIRCFQVALFKKLPTRACSRAWGKFCDMDLPLWLRKPVIGTFSWYFSCNVAEAIEEEIINYPSVGAFFRRQLKPDARKICDTSSIVSACFLPYKNCTCLFYYCLGILIKGSK